MLKCSCTVEFVSVRRFGQQLVCPITNTEYSFAVLTVLKTRSSGRLAEGLNIIYEIRYLPLA